MRFPLAIAFTAGFCVMALEMALARMAAPYFGSSMPVWASLISVVLMLMAVGYALGGRLSVRQRLMRVVCACLLLSAAGITALALLGPRLLETAGGFAGAVAWPLAFAALVVVVALAALPLVGLSAAVPLAIRQGTKSADDAGRAAGRVQASATLGSLLGTLLPALLSLPLLGIRLTLSALAALCLALAFVAYGRRALAPLALLIIGGAALLGPGTPALASLKGRVLYATSSPYHARIIVREIEQGVRELRLDQEWAIQSTYDPRGPSRFGSWPLFLLAAGHRSDCSRAPQRALILGLAAGTLARDLTFSYPGIEVDGVELDEAVLEVGRRFFELERYAHTFSGDARRYLAETDKRYDLIFIDAYQDVYLPAHLATREFFGLARAHLAPGGVVAANVLTYRDERRLASVLGNTLRSVFGRVSIATQPRAMNALLIAADGPARSNTADHACALPEHPEQRRILAALTKRLAPLPEDTALPVLTDDRAPVEHYTHFVARASLRSAKR